MTESNALCHWSPFSVHSHISALVFSSVYMQKPWWTLHVNLSIFGRGGKWTTSRICEFAPRGKLWPGGETTEVIYMGSRVPLIRKIDSSRIGLIPAAKVNSSFKGFGYLQQWMRKPPDQIWPCERGNFTPPLVHRQVSGCVWDDLEGERIGPLTHDCRRFPPYLHWSCTPIENTMW